MRERLPEFRVSLSAVTAGEEAIDLPYPDNLGQRTKLGGDPIWIQGDETPLCPRCREEMSFVAQIDSIGHTALEPAGLFMFGDVGMLYLFYCFGCGGTDAVVQSY